MKQSIFIIFVLLLAYTSTSQTWNQIGPEGGYFKEFTIHPNNPNIIFAGSDDGGGIWKSSDTGSTWVLTTSNFPNMTGWKIVFDLNSPNVIYGCDLYGRYGALKSIDGGSSWTLINSGLNSTYDRMVSGIAVKTSDTLFISTGESDSSIPVRAGNGVYRSYDSGLTWIPAGLQGETIPSIGMNDFGTIFAGSENNGLYYSNDNGATWLTHPQIPVIGTIFEIQSDSNVLLVASSEGVFLSTNWGINFSNTGLVGEFNFDACIHKTSPNIELFSSTLTGLKRYSSATLSWTPVLGSFFTDQVVIGITSDGTNVYCGGFSNSPIVKSTDGGITWNDLPTSPTATEINDIYIDPSNSSRMIACLMGTYNYNGDYDRESIYETIDAGLNWTRKGPDAHALNITVNPLNSQEFYLGSFAQGVYKTTDNFNSFTQLSPNGVAVVDVIVSSEDTNVVIISEIDLIGFTVTIKRSSDGGAIFSNVASIIANRLAFNPNNNDTVYVATNNGLQISVDNGLTFVPWLLTGEDCLSLIIDDNDVYTGTADGKLFKVSNAVAIDISGGWSTPVEVKSIFTLGNDLYIGLNGAEKDTFMVLQGSIWHSLDDGGSWTDVTTNMTSTNIYGNNIIETDGSEIYIGTYGGGIFKSLGLNLDATLAEEYLQEVINISPNPADLTIEITTENEGISVESINFRNLMGQDVSSQIRLISNNSKLEYDISTLTKGTYFFEGYTSKGKKLTRKFIKN